jgi:UPF0755 protein
MKKLLIPLLAVLTILIILVGVFFWWRASTSSFSSDESLQNFVIPKGLSAAEIGSKLYAQKLIKSPLAFKVYVQVFGKASKISAGEFGLSPSMTLFEIVETLQGGPRELWVTIPEGLRREEIAEIFIESLNKKDAAADVFGEEFLDLTEDREGYLFPDTYLFPPDATASMVVDRLTKTFDTKLDNSIVTAIDKSKYSLDQFIIMASIIERETITDEERPVVSGILWKRLETDGWLLQADASVQYAVANVKCQNSNVKCSEWWQILAKEDLEINSPYNSYKFAALPPTPIANPGLSSIKAAVFPEDSNYWFYIHDADGNIHYAETINQHNRNVRQYLGK